MREKIKCPKCGRVLGDTAKTVDAVLNCPNCHAVHVSLKIVNFKDYYKKLLEGEKS